VISQLIVNKFNGEIDFESTYGLGSSFYFTFEVSKFDKEDYYEKELQLYDDIDCKLQPLDILKPETSDKE
jgi:hypothetical protein